MYLENRHRARVWLGKPGPQPVKSANGRWFPIDKLPDDDSLGFSIDVRTIERWAAENKGSRRARYP